MASTTFIDGSTVIVSAWLNDVNNLTYNGVFQSSDVSITTVHTTTIESASTLTIATNGTSPAIYMDSSQNVVLGGTTGVSGYKVTSTGSVIAAGSHGASAADPSLTAGPSRAIMDFSSGARIGSATGTGSGGPLSFLVNNTSVGGFDTSGNFSITTSGAALKFPDGTSLTTAYASLFQSINNVTSTRAFGTGYTNTTGKPMFVQVQASGVGNTNTTMHMTVNGITIPGFPQYGAGSYPLTCSAIVPSGATYSCSAPSGTLGIWIEQY
jgi:phage baseplate assembly protein gpV